MKIKQVAISGFGRWSKQTFDLTTQMQVIQGQNESGKSTLRAFIVGVLFGFPNKKGRTNVYDPRDGSRYGGSLTVVFGDQTVKITRLGRTQSHLTITDLADQSEILHPEAWLAEQLAPLNQDSFDAIFNFSQQDLAAITQIKGADLQKLLLNIGAVGSAGWLNVASGLDKQADKQFAQRPTGKRPLNLATKHYAETAALVHEKALTLPDFVQGEKALMADKAEVVAAQKTVVTLAAQVKNHEQLLQQYDLYVKAAALKAELSNTPQSVSDDDWLTIQSQAATMTMHETALQTLNQVQTPQVGHVSSDTFEFETALAQAQLEVQSLQKQFAQRDDWLKTQQQLGAQFEQGTIPPPLSAQEKQQLTRRGPAMLWLMASLVVGVLGFLVAKPAVLLASIPAGIAYWQYQQHQRQVEQILAAYNGLTINEVLNLQNALKQQPLRKQKLAELNVTISDQQSALLRRLKPIASHFDVPLQLSDLPKLVVELQHRYEQQKLTAQHDILKLTQQQQQRVEEIAYHQQQLDQLRQAQRQIFARYQVNEMAELTARRQNDLTTQRQQARYQDLMRQLDPKTLAQFQQDTDRQTLQQALAQLQAQLSVAQQRVFDHQATLSNHQAQQAQLTSNDQFLALQQDMADEQAALLDQFGDYLADKLTVNWINQALQFASQNRFPKMQQLATKYFAHLTQGRYQRITFSETELLVTRQDQQTFQVFELSTGTQEQLYIALRLALSQVIADIVAVPLLIDDGFVNFDPQRKETMVTMLQTLAHTQQIIYFTTQWPHATPDNVIKL